MRTPWTTFVKFSDHFTATLSIYHYGTGCTMYHLMNLWVSHSSRQLFARSRLVSKPSILTVASKFLCYSNYQRVPIWQASSSLLINAITQVSSVTNWKLHQFDSCLCNYSSQYFRFSSFIIPTLATCRIQLWSKGLVFKNFLLYQSPWTLNTICHNIAIDSHLQGFFQRRVSKKFVHVASFIWTSS